MDRRGFVVGTVAAGVTMLAVDALGPEALQAAKPTAAAAAQVVIDIRSHGAVPDGVSDSRAAIQAAIDGAREAGGGVVWVPAGTFVTSPLVFHGPVTIQGTGWQSKLKLADGAGAALLSTPSGQTNYYGTLRDLAIDGNRQGNPSPEAHGIRLWAADHFRLEGIRVTNCGGAAIKGDGDSTHHCIAPYISNCYIDSCAGSGLHLNSYTYDAKIHHVDIGRCDKGVVIPGSSFLHDVSVWGCNVGFYGYWAGRSHLISCRSERSLYHGFLLDGCSDMILESCRSYENNQSGGSGDGYRVTGSKGHMSLRVSFVACHAGLAGSTVERQRYGFSDGGSAYVDQVLCNSCISVGNTEAGYALSSGANNVMGVNI